MLQEQPLAMMMLSALTVKGHIPALVGLVILEMESIVKVRLFCSKLLVRCYRTINLITSSFKADAECINTKGSCTCTCKPGYYGVGTNCES